MQSRDTRYAGRPGLVCWSNGATITAPKNLTSWEGYKLTLEAPTPQTLAGTTYAFSSWSDGGARSRIDIVTGTAPSTYTAMPTATSVSCTITGTSGADNLSGTSRRQRHLRWWWERHHSSPGGNNIFKGEIGTDTLLGAAGDDTYGQDGPGGGSGKLPAMPWVLWLRWSRAPPREKGLTN